MPGGRSNVRGVGDVSGEFSIREESSETFSSESSSQTEDDADEEASTIGALEGGGSSSLTHDCYMTQGYEEATLYGSGWSSTDAGQDTIELGARLRDSSEQHAELRVSSSGRKNSKSNVKTNNGGVSGAGATTVSGRKEDRRRCSLPSDSPSLLHNHRHT